MVHLKNFLLGSLVFLAVFECALLGLNPTFYTDDSPEIITASATLGVAHPPGYPIYMLAGRLMSLLPFPLCFSVNLLSALLAALISLLLFLSLSRGFHVPKVISLAFAVLWMAGATTYPSALSAKRGIYELAGVFVLAILLSLLGGRLKLAAFLYGLSMGGHWMSMAAYGPGLVWVAFERNRQKSWNRRDLIQAVLFLLLGCSLYLYLPMRAVNEPVINWGYPAHLELFLKHVSRYIDKGRDLSPSPLQWFHALTYYLRSAFLEIPGFGLLALAGIGLEWKRERRRSWGLLTAWAGLAVAVSAFSNFSGTRLSLLEDYSVSSWVFLILFSGLGANGLFHLWGKEKKITIVLNVVLLTLCLAGAVYRVGKSSQGDYTCVYDYTLNAFKALPRDACFFCQGDELQFPSWFFQWVEGKRPDLCVVGSSLTMDWNRIQLARSHAGLKVPFPEHDPDKVYYFGPLFPWMVENNPQRRFFISFPPKDEGLEKLGLAPWGLTQEGTPPTRPSVFNPEANDVFWKNARLRHLYPPHSSVDMRTWNGVLQDYGTKRLALALYELNQADKLKNSHERNPSAFAGKPREWYGKSLADLMVIKDWNPAPSQSVIEDDSDFEHLGDLYNAVLFHHAVLIGIGIDYFHLGNMDQARIWIQKAVQTAPQDSDVYFFAGLTAYQGGDKPEARKWIQKTLDLDPTNVRAIQLMQRMNQ